MPSYSIAMALSASFGCLALWYGLGGIVRMTSDTKSPSTLPDETPTRTQTKIEQMLAEARVILPGAQALLGFQFVVTMNKTFAQLTVSDQHVHFIALMCVATTVVLLITPAAVHRMAFDGRDAPGFHRIGSRIITLALIPLALGISLATSILLPTA